MCGRFVSISTPDGIAQYFGARRSEQVLQPSFNVTPGRDIYAVIDGGEMLQVETMRWGLVPRWAKDASIGNRMINARSETLASKNSFKTAFRRRRCLVPVDGFYEWQVLEGRRHKQPWYFRSPDDGMLALAGLWETWRDPANPDDPALNSCTIITCEANREVAPVHDRMPVILESASWENWLDPSTDDPALLSTLLVPAPIGVLEAYAVGTEVNRPGNNGPGLIEPVEVDRSLFGSDGTVRNGGAN